MDGLVVLGDAVGLLDGELVVGALDGAADTGDFEGLVVLGEDVGLLDG